MRGGALCTGRRLAARSSQADVVVPSSELPAHRAAIVAGWDQTWVMGFCRTVMPTDYKALLLLHNSHQTNEQFEALLEALRGYLSAYAGSR